MSHASPAEKEGIPHNVFLSWSGDQSHAVARAFHDLLKFFIPNAHPFISDQDISKGERGRVIIAEQLQRSDIGIIFVTAGNINSSWLNFEAGAISRSTEKARVLPFLLNVSEGDMGKSPLRDFQYTIYNTPKHRENVLQMIVDLHDRLGGAQKHDVIETYFERFWPDLEAALDKAQGMSESAQKTVNPAEVFDQLINDSSAIRRELALLRENIDGFTAFIPLLRGLIDAKLNPSSEVPGAAEAAMTAAARLQMAIARLQSP